MSQLAAATHLAKGSGSRQATRILGIDPGSRLMGWGVVECRGSAVTHIASATVVAPKDTLMVRLCALAAALEQAIAAHSPTVAAVETVFFAKNSHSALVLGQARGAALLTVGRAGLEVFEYTPGQIKQAVVGHGRADKMQVQRMVCLLLGLGAGPMGLDTSDALAIATCHAHRAPVSPSWQALVAKPKASPQKPLLQQRKR